MKASTRSELLEVVVNFTGMVIMPTIIVALMVIWYVMMFRTLYN
jgi:hypothetical protein